MKQRRRSWQFLYLWFFSGCLSSSFSSNYEHVHYQFIWTQPGLCQWCFWCNYSLMTKAKTKMPATLSVNHFLFIQIKLPGSHRAQSKYVTTLIPPPSTADCIHQMYNKPLVNCSITVMSSQLASLGLTSSPHVTDYHFNNGWWVHYFHV